MRVSFAVLFYSYGDIERRLIENHLQPLSRLEALCMLVVLEYSYTPGIDIVHLRALDVEE